MLNDRRTDKVVSFIVDSDYYKKKIWNILWPLVYS